MSELPALPGSSRPEPSGDMNLASSIFIGAAGMVGVCLTVVGVFQAVLHLSRLETLCRGWWGESKPARTAPPQS